MSSESGEDRRLNRLTDELLRPGERFDGEQTERIDVGRRHGGFTSHLFGGGIGGRADHDSGRGDAGCVEEVCDAEVHENRPERDDSVPDRAQQHVRRLDIAVDDAGVVDDRQRAGETDDERDDLPTGQRVLRKTVVKRLPRHELQCRLPSNMRRIRLASPRMPPRMRGETILLGLLYAAGAACIAVGAALVSGMGGELPVDGPTDQERARWVWGNALPVIGAVLTISGGGLLVVFRGRLGLTLRAAAGAALAALILVGLLYVFTWGLFKA
ncbi:hypothetical protein AS96_14390 [Microbacterium sp. MRS-1]|nr:hypothetical protein AS96_14390 [Microbacterium sp. MRS-1]